MSKKCTTIAITLDMVFFEEEDNETRESISLKDFVQETIDHFYSEHYIKIFIKNDKVITANIYRNQNE